MQPLTHTGTNKALRSQHLLKGCYLPLPDKQILGTLSPLTGFIGPAATTAVAVSVAAVRGLLQLCALMLKLTHCL